MTVSMRMLKPAPFAMGGGPARLLWLRKLSISIHTRANQFKEGSANELSDQYGEVWRLISSQSECINELLCMTFAHWYKLDSTTNHILEWGPSVLACF